MNQATTVSSYSLNPEGAKQAGMSTFINEKGGYVGAFTRAECVVSRQGTQGVEFDFKSDDGREAKNLTLWTINSEGKDLYGRKVLDAIMACIGTRAITVKKARIPKWDNDARADVQTDALVFPELMNKPIGVLLVREEYEPTNGGATKWKNSLVLPFEAGTKRTAKERLSNEQASALPKLIEQLRDKPLAQGNSRPAGRNGGGGRGDNGAGPDRFDDMPDNFDF